MTINLTFVYHDYMDDGLKKEKTAQLAIIFFLIFSVWWVFLFFTSQKNAPGNQLFTSLYGLMALWGGVWGLKISKKWGGVKSLVGKSIIAFSIGLLAQEFGQIYYSYHLYFFKEILYPSIGDIGYFGSIPLYIYGALNLAKVSGVKVGLRNFRSKLLAIVLPISILLISYFYFLKGYLFDWSKPLTIFLDFGYPLGQAIYVSIALLTYLLSRKLLGGIMKVPVLFILISLFVQYISDFAFLYQLSHGTEYAGGLNDYLYFISYYLMTLSLIQLNTVLTKLRNS